MKPILTVMAGGLLFAVFASTPSAKLPGPTPEEKAAAAAKAEKDAAGKAKAAKDLGQVQDRLAERYGKKGKGSKAPSSSQGANHADSRPPDAELTRQEAQNEMPKPGQANDHSTTARDPKSSSGRR